MRRRIAFLEYFPIHYRTGLYEEIARRMEADFYFYADERTRWHNKAIPARYGGDYRSIPVWRVQIGDQSLAPGIALALSAKHYDAVIKSLNGKLMLPWTFGAAKARDVPFVLWTGMWHHPTTLEHRLTRPLTEAIYRGADAIVAYGEHTKRFLLETPGVAETKVFVAGQAVNPTLFSEVKPARNGRAEVLFIGQFKSYKGIHTMLSAFERLSDTSARFRLIGNGELEPEMRARIAGSHNVEIVGHVPQERLPAELARSRCLVLPSETTELDREPWGLVVNEAMHSGLPVVASDAVGAAAGGLVEDGQNGFVVPERSPDELAAALRRLIEDGELARQLGERAREDVSRFNYERMGAAFELAVEHANQARRTRSESS